MIWPFRRALVVSKHVSLHQLQLISKVVRTIFAPFCHIQATISKLHFLYGIGYKLTTNASENTIFPYIFTLINYFFFQLN